MWPSDQSESWPGPGHNVRSCCDDQDLKRPDRALVTTQEATPKTTKHQSRVESGEQGCSTWAWGMPVGARVGEGRVVKGIASEDVGLKLFQTG